MADFYRIDTQLLALAQPAQYCHFAPCQSELATFYSAAKIPVSLTLFVHRVLSVMPSRVQVQQHDF